MCAGIAMHYEKIVGRMQAATRMQSKAVWDTVQVALNGMIFILLGEQLPAMWKILPEVTQSAGATNPWAVLGYIIVITIALAVLRFAWVWISMWLTVFRSPNKHLSRHDLRLMAIMATAGVRGAITLAGILTLPLLMTDGSPFPTRDLAIFIAMGVILCSLLIATIALPILTKGLSEDLPYEDDEIRTRLALNEAAIAHINELMNQPCEDLDEMSLRIEAGSHLLEIYSRRLDSEDSVQEGALDLKRLFSMERKLSRSALKVERDALQQLRKSRHISEHIYNRLRHELDLKEEALNHHLS